MKAMMLTGIRQMEMKNGRIDVKNMVTHRFPFSQTEEAFNLVAGYRDGVMKAMIDFS